MTNNKSEYIDTLLKTIEIQNTCFKDSIYFEEEVKAAFVNLGNEYAARITQEPFTLTQLKSIASSILTFWNESIGVDTEFFWFELKKKGIDFERNDELLFALNKGRFRRVDIGIYARKYWHLIGDSSTVKERFSASEIQEITTIVEKDEKTRFDILNKCFLKKQIPKSQYLKFGECMAYFQNCGLFEKYFLQNEIEELIEIWNNH